MAASGLSIGYPDLLATVGEYLGYGSDRSQWSTEQEAEIDKYVQSGIRQFYYPPAVNAQVAGHEWTFMKPTAQLTLTAGQGEEVLPAEFGRLVGDMYYQPDTGYSSIVQVAVGHVLAQRQQNSNAGRPRLAAIRYQESTGVAGQRQEAVFFPVPDAEYVLSYQYEAFGYKLTDASPYPLGGAKFAEVIIESCLAVAEQRADNQQSIHYSQFRELLADAVMRDQKNQAGRFGDMGETVRGGGDEFVRASGSITYKGQTW